MTTFEKISITRGQYQSAQTNPLKVQHAPMRNFTFEISLILIELESTLAVY